MTRRRLSVRPDLLFPLSLCLLVACGDEDSGPNDPAPPPAAVGQWVATALEGSALPAVAYEGPLGGPGRYRLLLDSSRLTVRNDGRYERVDWTTEQQSANPSAGVPWQTVLPSQLDDFGTWSSTTSGLAFESAFFENLRFTGTYDATADRLDAFTGLDLDPLRRTVRYRRR